MRRGTAVSATLAVVAAAAVGGWLAGRQITSPEQAALEIEAPPASLITVEVELTELTADVVTRADVGYDEPVTLGLSGALADRDSVLVVTSAPQRGAELSEGSVAIEIAGRPVFVLAGSVPVFRDLRPQDQGPDVQQLEEALARLGHYEGEPDPLWDKATSDAVRAWYETSGYKPPDVSDTEKASLRAAKDRLDSARDVLTSAEKALANALKGAPELSVRQARTELASAQAALTQARFEADQADDKARQSLAEAQQAVVDAEQALVEAQQQYEDTAEQAVTEAERALATAEIAREQAAHSYDLARLRLQSAQAGVHPDTGDVPTPNQHESLRLQLQQADTNLNDAEQAVDTAKKALLDARQNAASTDQATNHANQAIKDAEAELARRRDAVPSPEEQAHAITRTKLAARSAEDRLARAQQSLDDLLKEPDTEDLARNVKIARTEVDNATKHIADLEATTGVWLPAGELIFLKHMPVRVDRLTVEPGTVVSDRFMTVTGSELAVRGSISNRDLAQVKEGAEALIDDRSLEAPIVGTIRLVEQRAGTHDVAPDRHYMEIVSDAIPSDLVDKNVKIVIPVGGTDEAVLAVPAAALSATANGDTRVEVEEPDGTTRFVTVEPGLSTRGLVEVTPTDGDLQVGDQVVIGVTASG